MPLQGVAQRILPNAAEVGLTFVITTKVRLLTAERTRSSRHPNPRPRVEVELILLGAVIKDVEVIPLFPKTIKHRSYRL